MLQQQQKQENNFTGHRKANKSDSAAMLRECSLLESRFTKKLEVLHCYVKDETVAAAACIYSFVCRLIPNRLLGVFSRLKVMEPRNPFHLVTLTASSSFANLEVHQQRIHSGSLATPFSRALSTVLKFPKTRSLPRSHSHYLKTSFLDSRVTSQYATHVRAE